MRHTLRFALLALLLVLPASLSAADGALDIYWIDVEGGAATLVVTPAGETVLIDTGNPGRRDPDRITQVVTRAAGKKQIDHLVITHYHRDHYGGAETLATMLPIKNVHDNGVFDGMPDNPGKAYFELKSEERSVVQPGATLPLRQAEGAAKLQFAFLGARKSFVEAAKDAADNVCCGKVREKDRDGSDNANSVVMLLDFGPFRFLDAGDLTWNQETRLVCPKNLVGEVDVYQVTHHGLDSSNNPVVLESVKPVVAVMNNGVTKGCRPEVFETLKATDSLQAVYQVHKNLRPDGSVNNAPDEFIANHEQACQGHYIKLSVAADGKSYTISIPAHGHERTYKTKAK
ncbi:MAG: MBL fold metallo-hydrolase [Pirellulaceae bacterium]